MKTTKKTSTDSQQRSPRPNAKYCIATYLASGFIADDMFTFMSLLNLHNTFSIRFVHGWHGYLLATHISTILFLVRTLLTYHYMFYNRWKFSRQRGICLSSTWKDRTRRIEINSWLSSWTEEPQQPQGVFHSNGFIKLRRNYMASLKVQRTLMVQGCFSDIWNWQHWAM